MSPTDAASLIVLNTRFYAAIAHDFDDSRQYFWPGWRQLDALISSSKSVLDVACGNGRFGQYCRTIEPTIYYTGVDNSPILLENARASLPESDTVFYEKNILFSDYGDTQTGDLVVCFGFLHHIPSVELRQQFFQMLGRSVAPQGKIVLSLWQFEKNRTLMSRTIAQPGDKFENVLLENGDYILDWKRGGLALRYCHTYSAGEIKALLGASELEIISEYEADGKNNDNQYLILQKKT
jgi:tRNA (uracil-5-)-methyltransferase TRM9